MAADLRTRTKRLPFRRLDQGYGWGRICVTPGCDTILHHLHSGQRCYRCEDRIKREHRELQAVA